MNRILNYIVYFFNLMEDIESNDEYGFWNNE